MKKFKLLSMLAIGLIFGACNGNAQETQETAVAKTNVIEVIDFHSTHRCMTCNNIEASTKYTLETYFADELKSGKITFEIVNVDAKENYAIAEKFEAAGTALFLNVIVDGKETAIDLTDFAFMKGNEKLEFAEEFKSKLETELNKL